MSSSLTARVVCSEETRDRLRAAKRGSMTFDELLQLMLEQYDPEKGARQSDSVEYVESFA